MGLELGWPRRVILVDDAADLLFLMARALEFQGFEVQCFTSSAKSLAAFDRLGACAAVIDLKMPLVDGLDLARRVRLLPNCREIPLIALGGCGEWELERSLEAGFDCHLPKPVRLDRLVSTLVEVCDRAVGARSSQ